MHRRGDRAPAVVGVDDVAADSQYLALAEPRRGGLQRRLDQVHQHELHAATLQQGRHRQADSAGATGDEGDVPAWVG
jgi:hypothetical protein